MECPLCGAPAIPGDERCGACGAALPDPSASAEDETRIAPSGAGPISPGSVLHAGQTLNNRYHIISLLGTGGMGAVYQAWDEELGMAVALKTIRPHPEEDPADGHQHEAQLKRELVLARQITHKNVVRIHDIGEFCGVKFITMPYLKGEDLATLLKQEGALPVGRALAFARQIAAGLAAAHEKGVIHRDLKPANIMIEDGDSALLMDFGIARSMAATTPSTRVGVIVGTVQYMPPEQARGERVDASADVYAFGLILYEMLVGRRRLTGHQTAVSDLMRRMTEPPPSTRSLDVRVPPTVDALVTRCLQPDPAARYSNGQALVDALDSLDADGHPLRQPILIPRWKRALVPALAVFALALGGVSAWYARGRVVQAPASTREPISVLIANFENRAGDPVFDGALEQALGVAIEGAPFVSAYPRRDALRLAAQIKPDTPLDETVARLVAVREGIDVVLAGAIAREDGAYQLAVRALDGATGNRISAATVDAGTKEGVLSAVSRLAAAVRRALGDATPEADQIAAAETFTAASLEAAHEYAQAQDLFWAGRQQDAITAYRKAIAIDPTLGRAYAGLAIIYRNVGNEDEASKHFELATKHLDRMSDREKHRTLGAYYLFMRSPDRAVEELDALVRKYPADSNGLTNLALAHFYRRDMAAALDVARRALLIYPENVVMRNNMALYAMYAGDFTTARVEAKEVLRRNNGYAKAWLAQAVVSAAEGDSKGAADLYGRLDSLNGSLAAIGRGDLAIMEGRLSEAIQILEKGAASDLAAGNNGSAARKLAAMGEAAAGLGRRVQAIHALARATGLSNNEAVQTEVARVYISLGMHAEAAALAQRLGESLEVDSRAYARLIEGEIQLAKMAPREALRLLLDARRIADVWLGRVLAGRAHLELGEFTEAYGELDAAVKRQGEATALFLDDVPSTRLIPALHYYRARAQEGLGSPAAAESYRQFLAMRGGGVPDALVADARRRSAEH